MNTGLSVRGAINAAEKVRGRKYSPKQKKFLKLFAQKDFQDAKQCMLDAGYSNMEWNRELVKLKEDIKEIALATLMGAAPLAALTVVEGLNSDKPMLQKMNAAKEILDRVGVVKQESMAVDHKVTGGIFLIPAKTEMPPEYIDVEVEDVTEEEIG